MGIFSRKKKEDKTAADPVWQENPLFEQEGPQRISTVNVPMRDLYDELSASKKGGSGLFKKNSDKYNEVSDSMVRVLSLLASPLKKNDYESTKEVARQVTNSYQNLVSKCDRYLNRYAFSDRGKARQDIVEKIKAQAMEDQLTLTTYWGQYQTLPASEQASNVWQAVEIARRKKFYMKKADSEHSHVGGLASRLTVLKEGDLENTDTSGFFKDAEIFTYYEDKEVLIFKLMERALKLSPISDSLYEKAKEKMLSCTSSWDLTNTSIQSLADILKNMDEMLTVPEFSSYVKSLCALADSYDITSYNIRTKGLLNVNLQDGESINLTNRNVATSRMADLLGAGDVIARSETVEMVEPGKATGRVGNLMQKAEGKAAAAIAERYKNKTASSDSGDISQKITGNLQRQLTNLQVLDYITGQIDRHTNNYFIQEDESTGMLTGVTGIDNDFSFGDAFQLNNIIGQNGISIFNDDGTFHIPHMDAAMADRILAVNKEQLFFLLGDLLDPSAIENAWKRLAQVQTAIKKEKEESGSHFFLQNQEWNAETLEEFKNTTVTGMFNKKIGGTYVSRLLL